MTAGAVITAARHLLFDTTSGKYRWADPTLIAYVDAAQRRARILRPDLFLVDGAIAEPSSPVTTSSNLVLGYDQQLTLAKYVAGMAFQEDSSDTRNLEQGRALVIEFHNELKAM